MARIGIADLGIANKLAAAIGNPDPLLDVAADRLVPPADVAGSLDEAPESFLQVSVGGDAVALSNDLALE